MGSDIIHKCCICEQDFRPGALDKNGKCADCRVTFPTVKNKLEALALNRPEINLGEKVDVNKVRQVIKEELNEFKAVFKAELKKEQKVDAMAKAREAKKDKNKVETE